jgi:hypothetical protein
MSGVREVHVEAVEGARGKEQLVLRLLRGESLDLLARESGQPAGRIAGWRGELLQAGRQGLKVAAASGGGPAPG